MYLNLKLFLSVSNGSFKYVSVAALWKAYLNLDSKINIVKDNEYESLNAGEKVQLLNSIDLRQSSYLV